MISAYYYQRHHLGEQNRKEECYGEDPSGDFDEDLVDFSWNTLSS